MRSMNHYTELRMTWNCMKGKPESKAGQKLQNPTPHKDKHHISGTLEWLKNSLLLLIHLQSHDYCVMTTGATIFPFNEYFVVGLLASERPFTQQTENTHFLGQKKCIPEHTGEKPVVLLITLLIKTPFLKHVHFFTSQYFGISGFFLLYP